MRVGTSEDAVYIEIEGGNVLALYDNANHCLHGPLESYVDTICNDISADHIRQAVLAVFKQLGEEL